MIYTIQLSHTVNAEYMTSVLAKIAKEKPLRLHMETKKDTNFRWNYSTFIILLKICWQIVKHSQSFSLVSENSSLKSLVILGNLVFQSTEMKAFDNWRDAIKWQTSLQSRDSGKNLMIL